jgi:hypothetical protein
MVLLLRCRSGRHARPSSDLRVMRPSCRPWLDPPSVELPTVVPISGAYFCAAAPGGGIFDSNPDGSFMFQIVVPYLAGPGPPQLCVESILTGDVCTPFTVMG